MPFESSVSSRRPLARRAAGRIARRFLTPWHGGYPLELQIVPANACNFRCLACPKSQYDTDNRMLHRDVYARVREQVLPWVREVNLQGLGEPMLSPLFPAMLADARSLDLPVKFVTNASRFTPGNVADIVATRGEMTISIDGARRETHEESRAGADWDQQMAALAMLKAALDSPARHPAFVFRVNVVVTTRNLGELEGIMEIAARHGAASVWFIAPAMGDRADDFARDAITYHEDAFRARMPAVREKAKALGIDPIFPPYMLRPPVRASAAAEAGRPSRPDPLFPQKCMDPWRTVYVDVDGWIRPCCRALWVGMGNIMTQDFRAIWNNVHYRALRRAIHSDAPPDFCRECTLPWGITGGDADYMSKLESLGVSVPPGPRIGE